MLAGALEEIPEAQRTAVELLYLKGMTLAEVAERLERSDSAVAGLVHRGITTLRKKLTAAGSG